jgi:thiamine biosynthesis lipoprotein ApbE
MKALSAIGTAALLSALYLGGAFESPNRVYIFHHENVLGTSLELKALAPSPGEAAKAESATLAEVSREAALLSSWDPSSEFSRWFRTTGAPTPVSRELFETLSLFDQWRARTGGALNPAAEIVTRVWKSAAAQRRMPAPEELAQAAAQAQQAHWSLDAATQSATHLSDTPLAMNSLVKSYILDRAATAALRASKSSALVLNVGGDLVVRGDWTETVSIADPFSDSENTAPIASLRVRNLAVATSGNYRRGVEIGGVHYSHIVDPRTGLTAEAVVSSTVTAPRAADAGALATVMSVLSPAESARLASSIPGVEYLIVQRDGSRIQSAGWRALAAPPALRFAEVPAVYAAVPPNSWDPSFELLVNVELARMGGMFKRPYVAVWVEDKDHFPVRTLALWFEKDRWLPELRAWYRGDRLRALAEGSEIAGTVSSATRSPGKYTLKWDGRDNQGKPVKLGVYTVCIESAREHGTYQLIRREMAFDGTQKQMELTGNAEISSATLDYRKAAGR